MVALEERRASGGEEREASNAELKIGKSDEVKRVEIDPEENGGVDIEAENGIGETEERNGTVLARTVTNARKLLILDINGILADCYFTSSEKRPSRPHDACVGMFYVYRRPHCEGFLRFCFQNFVVGVWSSGKERKVADMIEYLFGELKSQVSFVWNQKHCTNTGVKCLDNSRKPLFLKELSKIWESSKPDVPWEQGTYGPWNTVLIDDTPYKVLKNPDHTAILPASYNALDEDNFLPSLQDYLKRLLAVPDVREFLRSYPLGQPLITESNPDWSFYLKVKDETSVKDQSHKRKHEELAKQAEITISDEDVSGDEDGGQRNRRRERIESSHQARREVVPEHSINRDHHSYQSRCSRPSYGHPSALYQENYPCYYQQPYDPYLYSLQRSHFVPPGLDIARQCRWIPVEHEATSYRTRPNNWYSVEYENYPAAYHRSHREREEQYYGRNFNTGFGRDGGSYREAEERPHARVHRRESEERRYNRISDTRSHRESEERRYERTYRGDHRNHYERHSGDERMPSGHSRHEVRYSRRPSLDRGSNAYRRHNRERE